MGLGGGGRGGGEGRLRSNPLLPCVQPFWFKQYFIILVFLGKRRSQYMDTVYVHQHKWKDENNNGADKNQKIKKQRLR